jgi:hypothetical protein
LTIAVLDPQPMDAAAPEPSANPAIKTLH